MIERKKYNKTIGILFCLLIFSFILDSSEPGRIVFSEKSEKAFIGEFRALGVRFSSTEEYDGFITANIQLRNNKLLTAQIDANSREFYINFISFDNGEKVRLAKQDLQAFNTLNSELYHYFLSNKPSRAAGVLLVLLDLLDGYPAGEFFGLSHTATNQSIVSLCEKTGTTIKITYDVYGVEFKDITAVIDPCGKGECFGRCGKMCGAPPNPLIQVITLDCLIHDMCCKTIRDMGYDDFWTVVPLGPCGDEYLKAVDDTIFGIFGYDCNAISGNWRVEISGTTCYQSRCHSISFTRAMKFNDQLTGDLSYFKDFFGSAKSSNDGRLTTLEGQIYPGNTISGEWRIPTYMGGKCGSRPAGYASGTFQGDHKCGEFKANLSGVWGWYDPVKCANTDYGSFSGSIKAYKVTTEVSLDNNLEVTTDKTSEFAPCLIDIQLDSKGIEIIEQKDVFKKTKKK